MSYLAEVKQQLEELHITLFEKSWREVIEPALKQSYANGVDAGKQQRNHDVPSSSKPRKSWTGKKHLAGGRDGT